MQLLREFLMARPERSIALVAHAGVLQALTGERFGNCELRTVSEDKLRLQEGSAFLV